MIFDYQGTEAQRLIAKNALEIRCDFPWERLLPKLQEGTEWSQPKSTIPVEWADLSRYAAVLEEAAAGGGHAHIHDEHGDTGHPIEREFEGRRRVLGLAWYSGKVSVERTLESNPSLAAEVLLAEGAHMVDFFFMTPAQREEIYAILHPDMDADELADHLEEHGWFEETGNEDYWSWVGEAFMGAFCIAFSDIRPSLAGFYHAATPAMRNEIRAALIPVAPSLFGMDRSSVYHDNHLGIPIDRQWSTAAEAIAAGRRPCRVCKPPS